MQLRRWALRFRTSVRKLTPEEIALLISVGFVLGVFPIVGFPTVLCLLASIGLRINIPALQLLNNISSPLQWALLLPLEHVGAKLWGPVAAKGASFAGKIEL